jgi:hypothetical protein
MVIALSQVWRFSDMVAPWLRRRRCDDAASMDFASPSTDARRRAKNV